MCESCWFQPHVCRIWEILPHTHTHTHKHTSADLYMCCGNPSMMSWDMSFKLLILTRTSTKTSPLPPCVRYFPSDTNLKLITVRCCRRLKMNICFTVFTETHYTNKYIVKNIFQSFKTKIIRVCLRISVFLPQNVTFNLMCYLLFLCYYLCNKSKNSVF